MTGIAFVFPGQGSQFRGMGRSLFEAFDECREVFADADAALGDSISTLCLEGSDDELARTENTQPAVLTVSVAAWRALDRRGVRADVAAGHSLGEYAAHVCAGTIAFRDAVRTVRERGRFMQEAVPVGRGAMAAVLGLDAGQVQRICDEAARGEVVSAANRNGPDQIVLAGDASAVARAVDLARAAGAKRAVPLAVSAPFHCALMAPAADRLAGWLEGIPFATPRLPVYCNVDAHVVSSGEAARGALVRQVASPVRWHETIEAMVAAGISTFVELGPGKVLTGLIRRIRKDARVLAAGDAPGVESAARELGSAA